MEKCLKLYPNCGKFIDDNIYTLTDNDELIIRVIHSLGASNKVYVKFNKDGLESNHIVKDGCVVVPRELLTIGNLDLNVIIKNGTVTIKKYPCIPLIIKDLDDKLVVVDEIVLFREEINNMKNTLAETTEKLENEVKKNHELIKQMILVE